MAMAGSSHSNSHSHHHGKGSHSGMSRGRPYALMLLLAFGAALLGVMVLHKLRERRIFGLLVKEKDRELLSLQFLLQKEKEYSKEMRRKSDEMKAKIYSLRTQKMELDRRVLEMQSTIDSLKDEQKAVETALEEKQNEIEIQREGKRDLGEENSQLAALQESLRQKAAEIEGLKHRLDNPAVNVSFINSDNLLSLPLNLTLTSNVTEDGKTDIANSTRVKLGSENWEGGTHNREMTVEKLQNPDNSQDAVSVKREESNDEGQGKKSEISQETEGASMVEKNVTNMTEPFVNASGNDTNSGSEKSDVRDGSNDHISGEVGKVEDTRADSNHDADAISKGGMKLESADSKVDGGLKVRGRHSHLSRMKGKRWRTIARRRDYENNGVDGLNSRKFHRPNRDKLSRRENEGIGKNVGREGGERTPEVEKTVNWTTENTKNTDAKADGRTNNTEVSDMQKLENEASDGDSLKESGSDLEEDKEGYKEETDDSEF